MNGKDINYLNDKFIELKTQFDERWKAHEATGKERRISIKEDLLEIKTDLKTAINVINKLPCKIHLEKMKSMRHGINWLWTVFTIMLAGLIGKGVWELFQ